MRACVSVACVKARAHNGKCYKKKNARKRTRGDNSDVESTKIQKLEPSLEVLCCYMLFL